MDSHQLQDHPSQQPDDHDNDQHRSSSSKKKKNIHNNDALLARKIDVLLQQQQPQQHHPVIADVVSSSSNHHHHHHPPNGHHHHHSNSGKKVKEKHRASSNNRSNYCIGNVYANECHVIALILLSRIQNFHLYLELWQRHAHLATHFLPRLLLLPIQQREQQQQPSPSRDIAVGNEDEDHDQAYHSWSLQTHWLRLVALLLSRFDPAATTVNDDKDGTIHVAPPPSIVVVVDALTEILLMLLENDETLSLFHKLPNDDDSKIKSSSSSLLRNHGNNLIPEAHVEVITSLSCALDMAFSSSGLSALSSPPLLLSTTTTTTTTTTLNKVDRILSCIWAHYYSITTTTNMTATEQSLPRSTTKPMGPHDEDSSKSEVVNISNKENYSIMLQTLTALFNKDDDDDTRPGEATLVQENGDAAATNSRLLDACWHILSVYGTRMASSSSRICSNGPISTPPTLPSFWKLALEWWCRCCHKNSFSTRSKEEGDCDTNNKNKQLRLVNHHCHEHYLSWAEFLLQIIQQPNTHDQLHQLLLQTDVAAADSSASYCSITQNLFQLLLACIVSPEQQATGPRITSSATATLGEAKIVDDDGSGIMDGDHENDPPGMQPNNRVLRPLAWTCLTNLLQSEKVGWNWLLCMDTTTKSSSSSSSNNRGRHMTTLVRLAVGEWKIQLGYFLAAGDDSDQDKNSSRQQKQQDCETLILVCGQFIVQTVQFVAHLADEVMDQGNDDCKKALPLLSATSINHLRRSLDEALDAAVQYLGLHPEQHGRVPQIDACVIRVLGSLLTEMNVFDQPLQRRPQEPSQCQQSPNQHGQDDCDEKDNATLHALRIAMELTTKDNQHNGGSGDGEKVVLQGDNGYHALMPSLAYVLASAEGDDLCVQLLKDYNVLDRDIMPPFLHSFWNQQRQEKDETFAAIVPWCCQVIELYVGLVTVVEPELLQADLIPWIRCVLSQLPSSPASEQQQPLVKSLESAVSCYVTLQGETQPPEPDFSIIQQALETCARCLSSQREE